MQQNFFSKHSEIILINNFMEPWNDRLINYIIEKDSPFFSKKKCQELFEESLKEKNITNLKNKKVVISSECLSGHPYSGGFNRELIADRLYKVFPNAKIIITIRNQLDIVFSVHQQMVKMGYTGNIENMLDDKFWAKPSFQYSFFNYRELVNIYNSKFNSSNIGIFTQEELSFNSQKFIKDFGTFMNLTNYDKDLSFLKVAPALTVKKVNALILMNKFRKTDYNPYPCFEIQNKLIFKLILKILTFLSINSFNKNSFKELYFNRIKEVFLESNSKLINNELAKLDIKIKKLYLFKDESFNK